MSNKNIYEFEIQFNGNHINSCICFNCSNTETFVNVLAQEGTITSEGTVNDTMSGENATQWVNATLVFAQEGFTTEDLVNETIDLGNDTMKMNATLAFAQSEGTNQTMQDAGQSANQTGEAVQGNASDLGSNITKGAKNLAENIGEGLKDLAK